MRITFFPGRWRHVVSRLVVFASQLLHLLLISCRRQYLHIRKCVLNGRSPKRFGTQSVLNALLLILWLILVKAVNKFPKEYRPPIYHRLCLRLDSYMFDDYVGLLLSILTLITGSWLLYGRFYQTTNLYPHDVFAIVPPSPTTIENSYYELRSLHTTGYISDSSRSDFSTPKKHHSPNHSPLSSGSTSLEYDLELENLNLLDEEVGGSFAPPIFLAGAWFLLAFLHQLALTIAVKKLEFLVSWVAFVILHFVVPVGICLWLYWFKAPGAVKLYALSCGLMNCMIVMTQFIFPNAPPLFIKLYGDNLAPSYDMIYTDGITRKDMKVARWIVQLVYYAAPTKFLSLPSVHLGMLVISFLFVCHYTHWNLGKLAALLHVSLQWWAAMYLAHHWRVDLLAGAFYAIVVFTLVKYWRRGLDQRDLEYLAARANGDWLRGLTFGMRLFRNTRIQWFFEP